MSFTGKGALGQKAPKQAAKPRKAIARQSAKAKAETHPLRKNAKGQPCTFRLPGCRGDPDYTVFCHYRRFGLAGVRQKPDDLLGAFGCDLCHWKQENRHPDCTYADMLRAMCETLLIQKRSGLIIIADDAE